MHTAKADTTRITAEFNKVTDEITPAFEFKVSAPVVPMATLRGSEIG
jgi:hypothetical protein